MRGDSVAATLLLWRAFSAWIWWAACYCSRPRSIPLDRIGIFHGCITSFFGTTTLRRSALGCGFRPALAAFDRVARSGTCWVARSGRFRSRARDLPKR